MQGWTEALKEKCTQNLNLTASDILWNAFRNRFNSESLIHQDICYNHAQVSLSEFLNVIQKEVSKQTILLLGNAPWQSSSAHSDDVVANAFAMIPRQPSPVISIEEQSVEEINSKKHYGKAPSVQPIEMDTDFASSSLVLQTLTELKKENTTVRERLDKEDETNK